MVFPIGKMVRSATMPMSLIFGALAAVVAGVYLLSLAEEKSGDPTLADRLADWFYVVTSSEEKRLSELEPTTQAKVRELLGRLHERGISVYVGQTVRTAAEEKANVEAGKTSAGLKYSWHELRRAVDLRPAVNGQPDYENVDLYREIAFEAEGMGFRQLGFNADGSKRIIVNAQGKGIWDGGHIEWREPYETLAQAVEAEGSKYGIA